MSQRKTAKTEITGPRSVTNVKVLSTELRKKEYKSTGEKINGGNPDKISQIPVGTDPRNFFILDGELLFKRRADIGNIDVLHLGLKPSNNKGVFSSFNGEPFRDGETEEDFWRRYEFVGVSCGSCIMKDGVKSSLMLACQYGGARTFINKSEKTIQQGEPVYVSFPGFDDKRFTSTNYIYQSEKVVPVICGEGTRKLSEVLLNSLINITNGFDGDSAKEEDFKRSMKDFITGFGTSLLLLMDNLGYIDIKNPGVVTHNPVVDLDPTNRHAMQPKLETLERFFDDHIENQKTSPNGKKLMHYMFPVTDMSGNPQYLDELILGRSVVTLSTNQVSPTDQLLSKTRNFLTDFCDILQECLENHRNRRIGTALNRSAPGTELDILFD